MTKFVDNIRKMAQTTELNQKIPVLPFLDKPSIPTQRGEGFPQPGNTKKVCNLIYTTRANSYDIADILSGTTGPILNDECDHIDTITGLTDFDLSQAGPTFGAVVNLIIQVDGLFK